VPAVGAGAGTLMVIGTSGATRSRKKDWNSTELDAPSDAPQRGTVNASAAKTVVAAAATTAPVA
jgi:hypothetical protein